MSKLISLVAFGDVTSLNWKLGAVYNIEYSVTSLLAIKDEVLSQSSDYILFWDMNNTLPDESVIKEVLLSKGNLWHIGSKLGLQNKPCLLDFIQPTSMLHLNVDTNIDHSSWKNTFKGCLLEKRVFMEISISNYSDSLDIIGLDFGYKAMKSGVITRYSALLSDRIESTNVHLKKIEELLFIRNNFDTKAFFWCYLLSIFKISPLSFLKTYKKKEKYTEIVFNQIVESTDILKGKNLSVSIVIATLERYPFLEKELEELRTLVPAVDEIIIVDQTSKEKRTKEFLNSFNDLPIIYLETDKIGQCSARNKGIEVAKSKFVWFLDDDMKDIPTNYLEKHLKTIYSLNADVSCGIPDEIGTPFINRAIHKIELSDGFPTNDVLVKRKLLIDVEGFDEKMDQKQSEDQEIGLRLMKKGGFSVKNNQLRIIHLRASRGGLRNHNVRKVTFASSRASLVQRRFLHHSELYLSFKHFTEKQVKKMILLNIRGTFIVKGNLLKRSMKMILGIVLLPHTIYRINQNIKLARKMAN